MMASGAPEQPFIPRDSPDTLLDLCIFYCCHNLHVVNGTQHKLDPDEPNTDHTTGEFPQSLGNKLLDYYLKFCIPTIECQEHIDILLQNQELCNTVDIPRRLCLTKDNLHQLTKNTISGLSLIGCEDLIRCEGDFYNSTYPAITKALHVLLERNRHNLRCLKVEILKPDFLNGCLHGAFLSPSDCCGSGDDPGENVDTNTNAVVRTKHGEAELFNMNTRADEHCVEEADKAVIYNCHFPNMNTLSYSSLCVMMPHDNWLTDMLLSNKQLTVCNLSLPIKIASDVECLHDQLHALTNLQSLILSNTSGKLVTHVHTKLFSKMAELKHLRHLDVSSYGRMLYSETSIDEFINFLHAAKQLVSLDIAGTNLSCIVRHRNKMDKECSDSTLCMPDFPGRQFEYLGLGVNPECYHKYIPATKISGVDDEDQLLVSVWSYQHNPGIMGQILLALNQKILKTFDDVLLLMLRRPAYVNQLFQGLLAYVDKLLDWNVDGTNHNEPLEIKSFTPLLLCFHRILRAYSHDRYSNCFLTITIRRRMLERFLVVIHNCVRDIDLNGHAHNLNYICRVSLLLLRYLDLPHDAIYCYMFEHYLVVVNDVIDSPVDDNTKMMALHLLHTTCRASQQLKAVIGGKLGTTELLLGLIDDRVSEVGDTDEVLEKLWSVLWTLTDEVPANSAIFLESDGVRICIMCLQMFPGAYELHKKISGAMSNVSESLNLRPQLMTSELVEIFRKMLEPKYEVDGIDVSSHAVAFLVLLLADGAAAWTIDEPARQVVVREVESAIDSWHILKARGVRFRSLAPMLIQIENISEPVSQYWGAWMICNLIKVKAADIFKVYGHVVLTTTTSTETFRIHLIQTSRYVSMLLNEHGEEVLSRVHTHPGLPTNVKDLVTTILADVALYDGHRSDTD